MDLASRHDAIVERLRQRGRVDVVELGAALGTSEVTIRRDLDLLAEAGVLRRVRGGAVSLLMRGEELPYAMRRGAGSEVKRRIADAASAQLRDGEAVLVDSGTTGVAVAEAISGRRLTVMPLSIHAIAPLASAADVTLLIPGGSVRPGEGSLVGPMTLAGLATVRFDTAVLTCCGVSAAGGVTAFDLQDAAVKAAAVGSSARTILVAESVKFARSALAVVCAIEAIDIVITDADLLETEAAALTAAGVEVVRV
ncbi:MAG: DeoR/GlpR family DNA-binding transcription regulator [Solirubrobacteraceae bacterium]|nr:DeoR/GlpR family DNA-binding transcription regulator [Solirubrobacteraceae bacterium]